MQNEMLKEIKDDVTAREVYQRALDIVKKEKPELAKNFVKSIGFGVSNSPPMSANRFQTNSFRLEWSSVILHTCFLPRTPST